MNPDTMALIEDLERQLARLRQIRDRLRATERVRPGESTFWSGLARSAYEVLVGCLTESLEQADTALDTAVAATSRSLGSLRA